MENNFFKNENLDPQKIDNLSRSLMIRNYPDLIKLLSLTKSEDEELNQFLETANQNQIDQVAKLASWKRKYFIYTRKHPSEEKQQIEAEMENDPELKEYIERTRIYALTENYAMWKCTIENPPEDYEGNDLDMSMSDDDIFTFFDLLEKYPDEVDRALIFMTSSIKAGPYNNSKMIIKPDENTYLSESEKLMRLRDYFRGQMTETERNEFHDEIIDDPRFQSMFAKIQNALR